MEYPLTGRCRVACCKNHNLHSLGRFSANNRFLSRKSGFLTVFVFLLLGLLPWQASFATSGIKNAVINACAPNPTTPDISVGCSGCHSSNNPSTNDLIQPQAGWSMSPSTYSNFCPQTNPPTTPTPPTTPPGNGGTAPPGTPGGGNGSPGGMGTGAGGQIDMDDDDDHDDDEGEMDDDDGGSASLSSFRSRIAATRSSRGSGSRSSRRR